MVQRLKSIYLNNIHTQFKKENVYKNIHQIPYFKKIVINCGLGEASQNAKSLEYTLKDISIITGQKPIVTRAKKAIAGFQIRKKMPVGISVTLRGEAMYAFLDRLIHLALPRIRDFQGLSRKSFDSHGNFHIGLKEQLMFPEIDYDKIDKLRGMDISIVTSCQNDSEALRLFTYIGMPFQKYDKKLN
jgi:large subunit ribosomal protein L5